MKLPKNYTECFSPTYFSPTCGGIFKNTESHHLNSCRRCREAIIARSLRMGVGEPEVQTRIGKPNAGGRVVRTTERGFYNV